VLLIALAAILQFSFQALITSALLLYLNPQHLNGLALLLGRGQHFRYSFADVLQQKLSIRFRKSDAAAKALSNSRLATRYATVCAGIWFW
jgi:hypothetical protein